MGNPGTIRLSPRLMSIAGFITPGNTLADVGCDHGFLSIYLVSRGICPKAIASDLRPGPLSRASLHVKEYGLEDKIETRLSDGLDRIRPFEAQTLVIAGMGGPLMERILSGCPETARSFKELILEPQSDAMHFRKYLVEEGYTITDEDMVREEGKYYPVLRVIYGTETDTTSGPAWEEQEYAYGKILPEIRHPVFLEYLRKELTVHQSILENLASETSLSARQRSREIEEKIRYIAAILKNFS